MLRIRYNSALANQPKVKSYAYLSSTWKNPAQADTQFRQPDGSLYNEQLFGTIGFDGMSTLSYHIHRPTMVAEVGKAIDVSPKVAVGNNMKSMMLKGMDVAPKTITSTRVSRF